ncbi:MAG: KTSC domain-containing protein [Kiritimatiellae bacterium]|nr:KTSC domain-containing protein [Kiritimatiellia bacterium]
MSLQKILPLLLVLACLAVRPSFAAEDAPAIPALSPLEGSRLLAAVGYDPATKTLAVVFRNSIDVFLYDNVPQEAFDGLMAAESRGKRFVHDIKPNYAGRAVPGGATNAPWRTPAGGESAP